VVGPNLPNGELGLLCRGAVGGLTKKILLSPVSQRLAAIDRFALRENGPGKKDKQHKRHRQNREPAPCAGVHVPDVIIRIDLRQQEIKRMDWWIGWIGEVWDRWDEWDKYGRGAMKFEVRSAVKDRHEKIFQIF